MKRIGILTDFASPDPTYSLTIVAEEQLGMLLRAGYEPVAIVEEGFSPERVWCDVELRHIPSVRKSNKIEFYEGWEDNVTKLRESFNAALNGLDVVITHDLIYQAALMCHNFAAHDYAREHPDVGWLHWIHSASPSPMWAVNPKLAPVQIHPERTNIIFPNAFDVPRVARNFRCEIDTVAVVPHSTDVCGYLGFQDITKKLVYEKRLLEADAILLYPVRLDRGKQVEYVIRTGAALKKLGRSVRVICADFHSTGGDKVNYREHLASLAIDLGLDDNEMTFLSQFDDSLKTRSPREVIRDLMLLCNVFVMPSRSETYSLIAQEAALCGAMLILNRDFPPMRSIYGPDAAYYQFSSNIDALTGNDGTTTTEYEDVDDYFHSIALRVAYELQHNIVLAQQRRIRQERNPDYVFKKFIEPLFHTWEG